jgi:hypothetical protein
MEGNVLEECEELDESVDSLTTTETHATTI